MLTRCSVAVLTVASMALGSAPVSAGQEQIPYLQKQAPTDSTSTLSGCVTRGPATGTHILTNITKNGEVAAKDTLQGKAVVLSGTDVDFSKHVGHTVFVTGSYMSHPLATGAAGTPALADAKDGDVKTTGTFTVKSLRMLAESCSKAANVQ
jgi:hypothetical protein